MQVPLNLHGSHESNMFLRSLWAEIKKQFGKCKWYLMGRRVKEHQTVRIGIMDIGLADENIEVGYTYKRKDSIESLYFNKSKGATSVRLDENTELAKLLKLCVSRAVNYDQNIKIYEHEYTITTLRRPLFAYRGRFFEVRHKGVDKSSHHANFNITISFRAFDKDDAIEQGHAKLKLILDILSIETNRPFWISRTHVPIEEVDDFSEHKNVISGDNEWLDEAQIYEDQWIISESGYKVIDYILTTDQFDKKFNIFFQSINHFHTGRKYEAQFYESNQISFQMEDNTINITHSEDEIGLSIASRLSDNHNELVLVLYISSLEVVSTIDAPGSKRCPECNQDVYKIAARVTDLVNRFCGEAAAKIIKDIYAKRSKYLHAGILVSNLYAASSIPQIDPGSDRGITMPIDVPMLNLREFSSFCLRGVLRSMKFSLPDSNQEV